MSSTTTGISPLLEMDTAAYRLSHLLDTLIAIRMDLGHSANGIAASPSLDPAGMQEVRVLLDRAIASAKEIFESVYRSPDSDQVGPPRQTRRVTLRRMAGVDRPPF
jgi:hypothetical protein